MIDIAANCQKVMQNIRAAADRCGRDPGEIKLLAASKSQGISQIEAAISCGIRLFGENYVQEAKTKKDAVKESVEWHMIGHLQRNKVKAALEIFSAIQSLDSLDLARALHQEGKKERKTVRTFVEVNLAGEQTKTGIGEDKVAWLLREVSLLSHVTIEGLMVVPPFRSDPKDMRPYFRALKDLQQELKNLQIPNVDLKELSMGMTHDYMIAVEEGATMVRVGTAIFGPREG
jgi:pyridoxal phosphate enzyme (YggS family)